MPVDAVLETLTNLEGPGACIEIAHEPALIWRWRWRSGPPENSCLAVTFRPLVPTIGPRRGGDIRAQLGFGVGIVGP